MLTKKERMMMREHIIQHIKERTTEAYENYVEEMTNNNCYVASKYTYSFERDYINGTRPQKKYKYGNYII